MDISRRRFVRSARAAGIAAHSADAGIQNNVSGSAGADFYAQLVQANERAVDTVLRELAAGQSDPRIRPVGSHLEALAASFCAPESPRHNSAALIEPMEKISAALLQAQHQDGTIDAANLHSPPHT